MKRQDARWRSRRIILNNDGDDLGKAEGPVTAASFLEARTSNLADSQVDSVFYCDGVFNRYSHISEESEFFDSGYGNGRPWCRELKEQGLEPLALITDWCRGHGREVFWSMRMNDQHDAARPHLLTNWKKTHRGWLMSQPEGYPSFSETMIDYSHLGVREKVFRIVQDVVTRYDVDGIELDFFRHPCLFRTQMRGEPVTEEQVGMMTRLLRRIRALCDDIALTWKHPVLIAIRIPDSLGYCREMGLDIPAWLREGLVDIVVGGGYFKLRPWAELATLGSVYQVPVYACLTPRRMAAGDAHTEASELPAWRAEALAAWRAGVNGIYTFNRFEPSDPIFRQIGERTMLETLASPVESYAGGPEALYRNPGFWLKDGRRFLEEPVVESSNTM